MADIKLTKEAQAAVAGIKATEAHITGQLPRIEAAAKTGDKAAQRANLSSGNDLDSLRRVRERIERGAY